MTDTSILYLSSTDGSLETDDKVDANNSTSESPCIENFSSLNMDASGSMSYPTFLSSDDDGDSIVTRIIENVKTEEMFSSPSPCSSEDSSSSTESVEEKYITSIRSLKVDTNNSRFDDSNLLTSPTWLTNDTEEDGTREFQKPRMPQKQPQSSDFGLWMTIAALSVFSILGNSFRVFLESLFGASCQSQTPYWLYWFSEKLNLCITSPQSALIYDLPVNMIGCFIMGMFQPCQDIGLQSSVPIAFLSTNHWFQTSQVLHIAIRTGFCGSLTTFASWNTSMLQLITSKEILMALFGYVVNFELAVSSLSGGQKISIWIHRYVNPDLANAEDVTGFFNVSPINQKINQQVMQNVYRKNHSLPDFERRFLDGLLSEQEVDQARRQIDALDALDKWKRTTQDHRNHRRTVSKTSESLLTLQEIERNVILEHKDPSDSVMCAAREYGWDVDALKQWAEQAIVNSDVTQKDQDNDANESDEVEEGNMEKTIPVTGTSHAAMNEGKTMRLLIFLALLALGVMTYFGYFSFRGNQTAFYQSLWLSTFMAPLGTILRWYLSRLNGTLKGRWNWFPMGTFLANISGSIVSALVVGLSVHSPSFFNTSSMER